MNKLNNESTTENVLHTQPDSASENEESDSVTDQSSSSTSGNTTTTATTQQAESGKYSAAVASSNATTTPTATQFSVQRSDTDGLRMKISAIRPNNNSTLFASSAGDHTSNHLESVKSKESAVASTTTTTTAASTTATTTLTSPTTTSCPSVSKRKSPKVVDKTVNNNISSKNNNTIETTLKVKVSNKLEHHTLQEQEGNVKSKGSSQKKPHKLLEKQQQKEVVGCHVPAANMEVQSNVIGSNTVSVITSVATTTSTTTATAANSSKEATASSADSTSAHNSCSVANNIVLPTNLMSQAPCLSDDTESGCSEATTTTVAASNEKATSSTAKKIKVKRKKAQLKGSDSKKAFKKSARTKSTAFSSDSEDEAMVKKPQPLPQLQQRAPRLLLTAINVPQFKSLSTALSSSGATPAHGSDNIGLSSSDNELPSLVSAAIKRVESDTDDTGEVFLKSKTKNLPQYQSTLLQDFMEKTQKLGQSSARSTLSPESQQTKLRRTEAMLVSFNSNSQTESITSSNSTSKKRRGRQKKGTTIGNAEIESSITSTVIAASNINESADSGVISTTSTTQSTSPSPKMSSTVNANSTASPQRQQHHQKHSRKLEKSTATITTTTASPKRTTSEVMAASSSSFGHPIVSAAKPKIDIAYLDKRMYATERVLYPPPRNKRRQSTSATSSQTKSNIGSHTERKAGSSAKAAKEEPQIDPVWRKIDVNKKFRRPSVSGYKSDGGGGNTTVCSKVLAAKSGYVSDYGSFHPRSHHHHNSGYKSDASAKSRYSTKSCASRRSRAKSCGYRSDCKDPAAGGSGAALKSTKFRRKRRCALMKAHSKSVGNLNDEQDILQLAGLSLGQSGEESNEYVCKPSLEKLPTPSVSKKYGEINRFIATGEYFGRGSGSGATFAGLHAKRIYDTANEDNSQDGFSRSFSGKLLLQRKNSMVSELTHEMLPHSSRKIKSRRSSVASYCSSYYSGTSKVRRRRRRKSFRFPISSGKSLAIDSKLLTEIDIITNTFAAMCRIQSNDKTGNSLSGKEKQLLADTNKMHSFSSVAASGNASGATSSSKRESRDKRTLKKRKMSENLDFALLSAGSGSATASGAGSTKRRHKKTSSSSPDDHKLPLKKRHYLLTPGEKSTEAAKLFANSTEAWAAAAAAAAAATAAKSSASTKSQQQFHAKSAKAGVTPKKRHLLQNSSHSEDSVSIKASNSSPLRVIVETTSISGGKLLDISPLSLSSLKQTTEAVYKKRTRLEGLVSKIANHNDEQTKDTTKDGRNSIVSAPQLDSETSCPPPGVFEPSIELEIQIPPITKLTETATSIITKSEVDSPLLMDLNKGFPTTSTKVEGMRVVETLLNKTGGNLLLKRKRKKINRTGFPTVRRKKRRVNDMLLDVTPDIIEEAQKGKASSAVAKSAPVDGVSEGRACDRVPQTGETSDTFLERANRTPRLSVVALERLQGTPTPARAAAKVKTEKEKEKSTKTKKVSNRKHKLAKTVYEEEAKTPSKKIKLVHTEAATPTTSKATANEAAQKKSNVPAPTPSRNRAKGKNVVVNNVSNVKQPKNNMLQANKREKLSTVPTTKTEKIVSKKSSPQKIITAKTLQAKVKLPAGIDPNTNFSCKIRLKRRSSIHPIAMPAKVTTPVSEMRSEEDIAAEAAAKDAQIEQLEHDILPHIDANGLDSEAASDTSDEKSSTTSANTGRKVSRLRKTYLPAGLFSDYFKTDQCLMQKPTTPVKKGERKDGSSGSTAVTEPADAVENDNVEQPRSLLPPPPYCEKFFRQTQSDFQLPYDIWWAYKNSKLPTRITVPSWNYRKIRTNIYAESVRPNTAGIDHPMCNCKADVGCGDNCLNRMVYTECSPSNCPTQEKCRNQKIQRHEVAPGVERFMTENKGWGVRARMPIKKGTYILEYVGEVVTEREFKDRMGTIYLNDTHHYCLHLDGGLVIDGHRMGSDGRFVNHSCQPNCEMQKWSVNGLSRMALFAKRNIEDGEELTYDYNFSLFNPSEGQPCRCNTPQCRGVIGGKSQRVKPLPVEAKPSDTPPKDARNGRGRQRKQKARKNMQRLHSKDVVFARVQQLSEKEKKLVQQHGIFLVRNFEKIRRYKSMKHGSTSDINKLKTPTSSPTSPSHGAPAAVLSRRPSTPSSLAAQISALCSPRSIKTRGLTLAVQDPEVEKMAKIAVILRDICTELENIKDPSDAKISLISVALASPVGNKKKKAIKSIQKQEPIDLKTIQSNIEQGYYKQPIEFDEDMKKIFTESRQAHNEDEAKLRALELLLIAYESKKQESYKQLLDLVADEAALSGFCDKITEKNGKANTNCATTTTNESTNPLPAETAETATGTTAVEKHKADGDVLPPPTEDIISCICGLYKDEGLMIQCARCMVWQHTECTKADVNAENYLCEKCEPREFNREISLEDFTEDGHRYYLTLLRGDLHVRQGDAVYVLRDIPIKDANGAVVPTKKHTYETIGSLDFNECDIFRVERLWKNELGKRFIFGHHFLRPHETFHEPSRRFYPNEVVRVPLYEVVPIELVIGRCWVLDRTTFCKGRPIECDEEEHCYICELRVDKSARFFSKAKVSYPICTKSYAFKKFPEKLKISKTYAPHDIDPAMLKPKKQKTDNDVAANVAPSATTTSAAKREEINKTPQNMRKRQHSNSPARMPSFTPQKPTMQTIKEKRTHLENVLKAVKLKQKNTQTVANEPPIDLSYLLSGRGARHRKSFAAAAAATIVSSSMVPPV